MLDVAQNLERTFARIADAALRVGRAPADVCLVAVTKTFPVEAILAAWEWGQRDFAENRPEEGAQKVAAVAARFPAGEAKPVWHMIGHIQRRKASLVVERFVMVHSVDRLAVAQKLSDLAVSAGRRRPILMECNVSGEASKSGYQAAGWMRDDAVRERLYGEAAALLALPGLRLEGLMTMAPLVEDVETARPVFAALRGLRDALRERFTAALPHLSMGMTDDFEVAIEEGATLVRVGRAIFGPYHREEK